MSKLARSEWLDKSPVMQAEVARSREALLEVGFRPAFYDYATCALYPSRDADGRAADDHRLDGLPDEAVAVRAGCGRVLAARATLIAGFERGGYFYTRDGAWRAAEQWGGSA